MLSMTHTDMRKREGAAFILRSKQGKQERRHLKEWRKADEKSMFIMLLPQEWQCMAEKGYYCKVLRDRL